MKITVLFFGNLLQLANTSKLVLHNVNDTQTANNELIKKFPEFKNSKYILALNQQLVKENTELKDGDELACLPPFAGG